MMESVLGTTLPVFIAVTVCVMGFAAYMTGLALANTWRSVWQAVGYSLLLGCADRFLTWSLFEGELFLLSGYLVDTGVLLAICLFAYRVTQASKMVSQYPWIYERRGLFGWRKKGAG